MGKHGKPATVTRYLTSARPGHPTAHSDGRVRVHRAVLYDRIGPGSHLCHWCGMQIEWFAEWSKALVADHVDGNTWNNDPANIVASCSRCNRSRHLLHRPTCANGHEWTEESTRMKSNGSRDCRICHRIRMRRAAS